MQRFEFFRAKNNQSETLWETCLARSLVWNFSGPVSGQATDWAVEHRCLCNRSYLPKIQSRLTEWNVANWVMNKQLTSPSEIWTTSGIVVFQLQRKTNDAVNIREMKIIYQLLLYRFSFCFSFRVVVRFNFCFFFLVIFSSLLCVPFPLSFLFRFVLHPPAHSFSISPSAFRSVLQYVSSISCIAFNFPFVLFVRCKQDKPVSYQGNKSGNYVCC